MAVAVVLALVAVAVLVARRDDAPDQGPADEGEVGVGREAAPVFGDETGATLLAQGIGGSVVSLDLDSGTLQAHDDVVPRTSGLVGAATVERVRDRFVYVRDGHVETVPLDLSEPPVRFEGLVNDRAPGFNDVFEVFPAGDTRRFWAVSGPAADEPEREFLAQEWSLDGHLANELTMRLGRTGETVVGATSDTLLVQTDAGVEVRDAATGVVRDVLEGGVIDTFGDSVFWQAGCLRYAACLLQRYDTIPHQESVVPLEQPFGSGLPGSLSPDGGRLALFGDDLLMVDLSTFAVTHVDLGGWDGFSAGAPVWSPDGQWLFAPHADPEEGGLLGYHVGDDAVRLVAVDGFRPWALTATDRLSGDAATTACPAAPPRSPSTTVVLDDDGQPGDSRPDLSAEGPCLARVVSLGPAPIEEPSTSTTAVEPGPLDPSTIVVEVANASGVEGLATAVSNTLLDIGYQVLNPVDADNLPVDTVYFQTSPDTRRQAEQVAADLGFADHSVQPYPGVDQAPANIGLAQVLVVIGEEGAIAANPPPTTTVPSDTPLRVEPATGLQDGQEVAVSGDGYRDRQGVMAIQCAANHPGENGWCDNSTNVAWSTPGGAFAETFAVRRVLSTARGEIDCGEQTCVLVVGGVGTAAAPISVFLAFA
jgi:hypothetical protein